jgi:hypothetical protein
VSKEKRESPTTGRPDQDDPAPRRETKPFNARRFMAGEAEPHQDGYLVDDAVGEEADRCRTSGPRAAAASRILGTEGQDPE